MLAINDLTVLHTKNPFGIASKMVYFQEKNNLFLSEKILLLEPGFCNMIFLYRLLTLREEIRKKKALFFPTKTKMNENSAPCHHT